MLDSHKPPAPRRLGCCSLCPTPCPCSTVSLPSCKKRRYRRPCSLVLCVLCCSLLVLLPPVPCPIHPYHSPQNSLSVLVKHVAPGRLQPSAVPFCLSAASRHPPITSLFYPHFRARRSRGALLQGTPQHLPLPCPPPLYQQPDLSFRGDPPSLWPAAGPLLAPGFHRQLRRAAVCTCWCVTNEAAVGQERKEGRQNVATLWASQQVSTGGACGNITSKGTGSVGANSCASRAMSRAGLTDITAASVPALHQRWPARRAGQPGPPPRARRIP